MPRMTEPGRPALCDGVRRRSRRAFVANGWSMLALVVFIVVAGAHLAWVMNDPRWVNSKLLSFLLLFVATPLVIAVVLALTAYFLAARSDAIANSVLAGVLLLMSGARVGVMTGLIGRSQSPAPANATGAPAPPIGGSSNPPSPPLAANPPPQRTPKNFTPPSPGPRPQTDSAAKPVPATAPAPPKPDTAPASASFEDVLAALVKDEPRLAGRLDDQAVKLDADIAELSKKAGELSELLRKRTQAKKVLEDRRTSARALADLAGGLESRLRAFERDAEKTMESAGLDIGERVRASQRLGMQTHAFERAGAAADYQRGLKHVETLLDTMAESIGKWSYDKNGEVTSKDAALDGELRSAQFWVKNFRERIDELSRRLRGQS